VLLNLLRVFVCTEEATNSPMSNEAAVGKLCSLHVELRTNIQYVQIYRVDQKSTMNLLK